MSVAKNHIREIRQMRGFTQEQMADFLGVSRPTYINIEAGKKDLTLRQAEALSAVLRVTLADVFEPMQNSSLLVDPLKAIEKYRQIILSVLKFGADADGKITKTKLAKLVYLADFVWYYENLKPMSGMTYRKLPQGPVAYVYFWVLDDLEQSEAIACERKGKAQMLSLVEPNPAVNELSDDEIRTIKKICNIWKNKNTSEIVNFTHEQLPWQICRDGEEIPYGLITQEVPEKIYGDKL